MTQTRTSTSPLIAPVHLVGGPDDWHGRTLDIYTPADLAAPRDTLGTYLISDGVPRSHPDPGARAVYSPNDALPAALWFFRGWFPSSPSDPEHRQADELAPVSSVALDAWSLPTGWEHQGVRHTVARVLAHWQAEDNLAALWHVRAAEEGSPGRDWALRQEQDGQWSAGPLPAIEDDVDL